MRLALLALTVLLAAPACQRAGEGGETAAPGPGPAGDSGDGDGADSGVADTDEKDTGNDVEPTPGPFALAPVAAFTFPSDVRFLPGAPAVLVAAQLKDGVVWEDLGSGARGRIAELDVGGPDEALLSLAFHPRFPDDPRLFVHLQQNDPEGAIRVLELTVGEGEPVGGEVSRRTILDIPTPLDAHAGGQLRFGPDGMLYVGIGDGGQVDVRDGSGQAPDDLFGKILRLDVDAADPGSAYAVPRDNPFVGREGYRPEIWALGLRNPWRMVFDEDGGLVVADVGESGWEEIDRVEAGGNYGWPVMEGEDCLLEGCDPAAFDGPVYAYPWEGDGVSVSGGAVYTGEKLPALRGLYVMGDWVTGIVRAVDLRPGATARVIGHSGREIVSVERGPDGEIYLVDLESGEVLRLEGIDGEG